MTRNPVIIAGAVVIAALSAGCGTAGGHSSTSENPQATTLAGKVNAWMASRINSGAFTGDGIVPGDGVVCAQSALGRMYVSCSILGQDGNTVNTALVTVYNPDNWAHSPINVSFSQR
jgi:hypothetical protein